MLYETIVKALRGADGEIKAFVYTADEANEVLDSTVFVNRYGYGSYEDGFVLTDESGDVSYAFGESPEDNFFDDIQALRECCDKKGVTV